MPTLKVLLAKEVDKKMSGLAKGIRPDVQSAARVDTGKMRRETNVSSYSKKSKSFIVSSNAPYSQEVDNRLGYARNGKDFFQVVKAAIAKSL